MAMARMLWFNEERYIVCCLLYEDFQRSTLTQHVSQVNRSNSQVELATLELVEMALKKGRETVNGLSCYLEQIIQTRLSEITYLLLFR